MSEEDILSDEFRPVEQFMKSHKEKLKKRFNSELHTGNLRDWGIEPSTFNKVVDEVLEYDSLAIAKFITQYRSVTIDERKGVMEKKRQLILDVQNLVLKTYKLS